MAFAVFIRLRWGSLRVSDMYRDGGAHMEPVKVVEWHNHSLCVHGYQPNLSLLEYIMHSRG